MAPIPAYRWGQITICPRKNNGGRWIVGEIYIVLKKFDASKSPWGDMRAGNFPLFLAQMSLRVQGRPVKLREPVYSGGYWRRILSQRVP
jgi:hypothetical protein